MPVRHQPILAAVLLAALAASAPSALAQQGTGTDQGTGGQSTGAPGAGPQGDAPGASGTTGDLNAPAGQRSPSDEEDRMSTAPAVAALSPEQVRRVQQRLAELGHDPGPADGTLGERTHEALRAFQQARGIEPTGEPDRRTLAELGIE